MVLFGKMNISLCVTLLFILGIGLSKQQCPNNYPFMSYINNMSLKDKLIRAEIVLYGQDVTDRSVCSLNGTCSQRTITFSVHCVLKNPSNGPEIPTTITIGTFDAVDTSCGTVFPSNSRNDMYIVLVRYDRNAGTYDWDEVQPRHTAVFFPSAVVMETVRSTCGLITWLPPAGGNTTTCPRRNGPKITCAYECPSSWLQIEDRCFWIDQGEKKSLPEAATFCEEKSAYLLSIQTESLWKALKTQLPPVDAAVDQTFWTNGKCRKRNENESLCFWTPQRDRDNMGFQNFKESPWIRPRDTNSTEESYVSISSSGWIESASNMEERYVICDKDASATVTVMMRAPATGHLGSYCCIDVRFRSANTDVQISSSMVNVPAKEVRNAPAVKIMSNITTGTYFTILAVLSPHYDIMTSYHNVTAQWLIVNAVLNEDETIDVKAGKEWLSYKLPKVFNSEGMYFTVLVFQQSELIARNPQETLDLVATNTSYGGEIRYDFDIKLFSDILSESMALYDHKQVLLSFDESSFYYAIKGKVISSAEACRVMYPDIKTYGDYAICPAPPHHTGGSTKSYSQRIVSFIFTCFVMYFTS